MPYCLAAQRDRERGDNSCPPRDYRNSIFRNKGCKQRVISPRELSNEECDECPSGCPRGIVRDVWRRGQFGLSFIWVQDDWKHDDKEWENVIR